MSKFSLKMPKEKVGLSNRSIRLSTLKGKFEIQNRTLLIGCHFHLEGLMTLRLCRPFTN